MYKVAELSQQFGSADIASYFSSEARVKHPKSKDDNGIALVRMLLEWAPDERCTVQQALAHSFFRPVAANPDQCHYKQAEDVVLMDADGRLCAC